MLLSEVKPLSLLSIYYLSTLAEYSRIPLAFKQPVDEFNDEADTLKWLVEASSLASAAFALLIVRDDTQF